MLTPPQVDSVYHAAAEEARIITDGRCSTVEHRLLFRIAMMEAISKKVTPTVEKVDAMRGTMVNVKARALRVSQCSKCSLRPDNSRTIHIGESKCEAVVPCEE